MTTPYDGKIGLWHVAGSWIGEPDIESMATNVNSYAPNADAIFVKTSNADSWMGVRDRKESMSIDGPDDITRWVNTLANFNLEFHAWSVPRGENVQGEIDVIVAACQVPGVRSMILDVEPFSGFWLGDREDVIQLMSGIRERVGPDFHIGMSCDPRTRWYNSIFPDAWRPYVDSIHPQCYWALMERDAEDVITEAYVTWSAYGLPIYPVLQGFDVTGTSIREAQAIARSVRGATGLSYFRIGTLSPLMYSAINEETVTEEVGPDDVIRRYDWEKIIDPSNSGFRNGSQVAQSVDELFSVEEDARGRPFKYISTKSDRDTIWAQWIPRLPSEDTYEISVYVPDEHATTTQGQYHIHGIVGRGTELLVSFNQSRYRNQWVPLVVYQFKEGIEGGNVNLTDLTGEDGKEIAFSAIRWRRVISQTRVEVQELGAGLDSPVGTEAERRTDKVWPGTWFESIGYAQYYSVVGPAYHTGADLNNNQPVWDSDRDAPVYSAADGIVITSAVLGGSWGHVVNIRHDPLPDGRIVYTRSAHLNNPLVVEGQRVKRGQQIGQIGNSNGRFAYHLHYDVVITDVLESNPGHWPGLDLNSVKKHYVDPAAFIRENRPQA